MKDKNRIATALSVLSFSIISSTVILSITILNMSNQMLSIEVNDKQENVMILEEAADYLGVMPMSLEKTIKTTSVGIPFLKLEDNSFFALKG